MVDVKRAERYRRIFQHFDVGPRFKNLRERKYRYILKKLGLPIEELQRKRKCLVLQIDGLSYRDLISAMNKGFMRNVRKLLDKRGYVIQKLDPGLPSNTAYFQSSAFYGRSSFVPGYYIVDKESKKRISVISPYTAPEFEKKHLNHKGILYGGSSYCTVFSGSASESYLTLSTILQRETYRKIPLGRLLMSMFLNPVTMLRLAFSSVLEILYELGEALWTKGRSLFEGSHRNPFIFSLSRVFFNVLAGELITLGTILDLNRGKPIIWRNDIAYDELGHHRGPQTLSAYRVLWTMDKRIRRILKNVPSDYDVYILSDHGMTPATPFEKIFGYSFAQFVRATLHTPVLSHAQFKADISSELFVASLWKIAKFPFKVFKPIGWLFGWLSTKWTKGRAPDAEAIQEPVVVEDSSGLAHIYFMNEKVHMTEKEIEQKYPGVVKAIVSHPGIGIGVTRQANGIEIYVRGTRLDLSSSKSVRLLSNFGDPNAIIPQLERLMKMKYAGDILVFGDYDGRRSISFTDHLGLHSGIGGPQNEGFIIAQKDIVPKSPVRDALELYAVFRGYTKKS